MIWVIGAAVYVVMVLGTLAAYLFGVRIGYEKGRRDYQPVVAGVRPVETPFYNMAMGAKDPNVMRDAGDYNDPGNYNGRPE